MKILLGHNFYRYRGGEDEVVEDEAQLLKDKGEEVFFYHKSNKAFDRLTPLSKLQALYHIGWSREAYTEVRSLIRQHKPEVAHFHNLFYRLTPSVYQACHEEGVPVVQTLHNYRIRCANGLYFRNGEICQKCLKDTFQPAIRYGCFQNSRLKTFFLVRALQKYWEKGIWAKYVRRFIVLSEFSKQKHLEAGLPKEKMAVKPNFCPPASEPGKKGNFVLYLGRLSLEKGVDVLVEAWRKHAFFPLKIAGDGPQKAELQAKAGKDVEFLGALPKQDAMRLLQEAKMLVVPSVCYENFPRVIVEAFSMGTPVLCSKLGGMAEIVEEGVSGFHFEPGNPDDLLRQMKRMKDMDLTQIQKNARKIYQERYTAEGNYSFLRSIYEEAICAE